MCTKPRLPANHARDPLSFLSCKSNPPPRPLIKPGQGVPSRAQNPSSTTHHLLSPQEPTSLLSPNEQKACAEAARQAASLVAVQLKLPVRVREAYVSHAVAQVTGLPAKSPEKVGAQPHKGKSTTQQRNTTVANDEEEEDDSTGDDSSDDEEEEEEEEDLGTVRILLS